jgi:hypothetical protein
MKKALVFAVSAALVLGLFGACTSFQASGLEFHNTPTSGDVLGDFDVTVTINKFLGTPAGITLANIGQDSVDPKVTETIRNEIASKGGTAAVNVKVENQATPLQIVLTYITGAIYAPATVHITGTVIK